MKSSPASYSLCLTVLCLITVMLSGFVCPPVFGQQAVSSFDRERGRMMLNTIKDDLKKNYYDPGFHGVDVEARFKEADEKIKKASNLGTGFRLYRSILN